MSKSFILLGIFFLTAGIVAVPQQESKGAYIPLPPDAGDVSDDHEPLPVPPEPVAVVQTVGYPVQLSIPSLRLTSNIIKVGINSDGEMDVPDGDTKNVGWYQFGTIPGEVGSAVIDAHVYAAFSKLRYLKVGGDIYVLTESGDTLHFVVTDSRLYKLGELPADLLFNQSDAKRLNLITCAGRLLHDHSTYDHRLVVYATLVED